MTESLAMFPTASVSGYYFANPKAEVFRVGKNYRRPAERLRRKEKCGIEFAKKMAYL